MAYSKIMLHQTAKRNFTMTGNCYLLLLPTYSRNNRTPKISIINRLRTYYHTCMSERLKTIRSRANMTSDASRCSLSETNKADVSAQKASVYVHWPYCKRRCTYCNFNKYIDSNVDDSRMTKCLVQETSYLLKLAGVKQVSSVFFGGGTPSLAQPSTISAVLETIDLLVGCQGHREVTLEVNPSGLETAKLKEFKACGVNRASLGIQTLDSRGLAILGREHSPSESLQCLEKATSLFNGRVSIDLIFGWPGQTLRDWLNELELVLPLCGDHVSLYQLTLERGTLLHKLVKNGKLKCVAEDEQDNMYLQGMEILWKHGFERYEVSNFAKQDSYCLHNLSYWCGHQYIGVGPGAHGRFKPTDQSLREARIQTLEPNPWMYEVEKFGHATRLVRPLTPVQQLEELLISGLRTKWGVSHKTLSSLSSDVDMHQVLRNSADVRCHVDGGFLLVDSAGIRATDKGLNVLDSLLPDLLTAVNQNS